MGHPGPTLARSGVNINALSGLAIVLNNKISAVRVALGVVLKQPSTRQGGSGGVILAAWQNSAGTTV